MGLDIYFKAKRKDETLRKAYDEVCAELEVAEKRLNDAEACEMSKREALGLSNVILIPDETPNEIPDEIREMKSELDKLDKRWDDAYKSLYSEAAYFRKVNFLLPYFGYEENLSEIVISRCEVEELVDDCKRVLAAKDTDEAERVADELLPTEAGFFFGNTDYDNWYFEDVQKVADKFTEILDTFDFDENELVMSCWW